MYHKVYRPSDLPRGNIGTRGHECTKKRGDERPSVFRRAWLCADELWTGEKGNAEETQDSEEGIRGTERSSVEKVGEKDGDCRAQEKESY